MSSHALQNARGLLSLLLVNSVFTKVRKLFRSFDFPLGIEKDAGEQHGPAPHENRPSVDPVCTI